MTVATLPPVRRPPHDPTSLLLDGRLGWSVLDAVAADAGGASLTLARSPGSLRRLTEPSGSFGGLRLPANVAVSRTGDVWLLDDDTAELRRFDPCACAFVTVACFGGAGTGARQLQRPGGIAVAGHRMFVCDAGNGRLEVLELPTTALGDQWRAPMSWEPTGVVVDRRFRVHVADPLNGMVHEFSWTGRYLGNTPGVGASVHLAIDSTGTVYAAGPVQAYRLTPGGAVEAVDSTADDLTATFPRPPFAVGADGRMRLGPCCTPPRDLDFDLHGNICAAGAAPALPAPYETSGCLLLGPLDSRIDDCTWHRVILRGDLPSGCRVEADTFTANVDLPGSEVDLLDATSWETRQSALQLVDGQWDAMVRSGRGRYLWLRLRLFGNGRQTPRLDSVEVEYPRVSLRRYMPAVYGAEPDSADFTDRFLALFDRSLRGVEEEVDDLARLFDARSTTALDWLATWVGLVLDPRLPESTRRRMLARSAHFLDIRGTYTGLRELLLTVLGFDQPVLRHECHECAREPGSCRRARCSCPPRPPRRSSWQTPPLVLEWFRLRRWLQVGAGRLGDESVLWGRSIVNRSQLGEGAQVGTTTLTATQDPLRDPFHVYAHRYTVFVPASAGSTPERRRVLEQLLRFATPAHTEGVIAYVEPRFRIGVQSSLGLDSVVARVPEGVVLGDTALGHASVLTGEDGAAAGPSHLGTTTVLG